MRWFFSLSQWQWKHKGLEIEISHPGNNLDLWPLHRLRGMAMTTSWPCTETCSVRRCPSSWIKARGRSMANSSTRSTLPRRGRWTGISLPRTCCWSFTREMTASSPPRSPSGRTSKCYKGEDVSRYVKLLERWDISRYVQLLQRRDISRYVQLRRDISRYFKLLQR